VARDAYDTLKAVLATRFSRVNLWPLE